MRLGILGLGRAASAMLPTLVLHPEITITAGCDLRPEAREQFARSYGGQVYDLPEALCASAMVDAVYIATPHQEHCAHALLAFKHGLHALIEKPMALSLAQCDTMITAARDRRCWMVIGPTHGWDPAIQTMRALIRAGRIGQVGMVHTWNYTNFLYRPRRPEELDTAMGGGIAFNQVPHQVEVVRELMPSPIRRVRAQFGRWDAYRPTEGSMAAWCQTDDGAVAVLVYSGYDHWDSDEFFDWVGEEGEPKVGAEPGRARQALRGLDPAAEAARKAATGLGGSHERRRQDPGGWHLPHFGLVVVSGHLGDLRNAPDGVWLYDNHGARLVTVPRGPAIPDKSGAVDEFSAAILRGQPPRHDGAWGRETLRVCLAMLGSADSDREVLLDSW